ncbi:MAG: hypothetical protein JWO59_3602 [Chloroflexi bacterium]|nr:hypothetical protein [Chloroflexota bacterium]
MTTKPAYKLTTTDRHIIEAVERLQGFGGWAGFDSIVQRVQDSMNPGTSQGTIRNYINGLVRESYLVTNGGAYRRGDRKI